MGRRRKWHDERQKKTAGTDGGTERASAAIPPEAGAENEQGGEAGWI